MNQDSADEAGEDNEAILDGRSDHLTENQQVDSDTLQPTYNPPHTIPQEHALVHQETKWKRLRKHYSDTYLECFLSSQTQEDTSLQLTSSQLGSVQWTSLEKATLFQALASKGRHDLPKLAAAIGTKSIVEIRDYLDRLKEADAEHQMFAKHAKNVSMADLDAAIEINGDLEDRLEQAADALATFQDNFDLAKAKGRSDLWLIDTGTAEKIDADNEATENRERSSTPEGPEAGTAPNGALRMFYFSTMLDLSRSTFMNPGTESEHDHWTEYAEENEEPSLTVDAAEILYNLVKGLLQRILQTSIFLAQSRIRSTTSSDYTPSKILRDTDVTAALAVLNLPLDSWDYWTTFARRSGAQVVLGDHRKGQNEPLTLHQIENTLSVRSSRGRRRSLSAVLDHSSPGQQTDPEQEPYTSLTRVDMVGSVETESAPGASAGETEDGVDLEGTTDDEDGGTENEDDSHGGHDSDLTQQKSSASHKRRRVMIDEAQEAFLESLDRTIQLKEERHLERVLGLDTLKEDIDEQLPKRPRVPRKTKEDLKDWSDVLYHSSWEKKRPFNEVFEESSEED